MRSNGDSADYGHLSNLIKLINNDNDLKLQLIATGSHLSRQFGFTFREIEADNFRIDRKIDLELNTVSPETICNSMALGLNGFAQAFKELRPDIIVILGDRYEILTVASAALIFRIPIAHISGGELTIGAIDEAIRHSLTKCHTCTLHRPKNTANA